MIKQAENEATTTGGSLTQILGLEKGKKDGKGIEFDTVKPEKEKHHGFLGKFKEKIEKP
jgi:hypothetical protein